MSASILIVSAGEVADANHELVRILQRQLKGWRVMTAPTDGALTPAELDAVQALVIILSPGCSALTADTGIGRILGQAKRPVDASVFPVLLAGARMPGFAELPEPLRWFHFINAIEIGSEDLNARAIRLAEAIKNTATFEEPDAPGSLLSRSLRLAYRPMLVGPLWTLVVLLILIVPFGAYVISFPQAGGKDWGLRSIFVGVPLICGVFWGGRNGRRLGQGGTMVGASIGLILPWATVAASAALSQLAAFLLEYMSSGSPPQPWRIDHAAFLGLPSAVTLTLVSAGRRAAKLSARRHESRDERALALPLALGAMGFAAGGVAGWTLFTPSPTADTWFLAIVMGLHLGSAGVLMGFMRGACEAIGYKRKMGGWTSLVEPGSVSGIVQADEPEAPRSGRSAAGTRIPGPKHRNVFLSYRRRDSAEETRRIYDRLVRHMKGYHVFRDVDAIPYGLDFTSVLRDEVARSDAFVAVIGREWLTITDKDGRRMLDCPGDFVRLEIELALARGVPVVVALVDGATAPAKAELPTSIAALAACPIVSMATGNGMESLRRALDVVPAAPTRCLSTRERLDTAVDAASMRGRYFSFAGAVLGAVSQLVIRLPNRRLEALIGAILLFSGPIAGGWMTGRRLGNWKRALVMATAMPLVTYILLLGVGFFGVMAGLIAEAFVLGDMGSDVQWKFFLCLPAFLFGATMALICLRSVVRQRVQRIRVSNAAIRVIGGAAVAACLGIALSFGIFRALPPVRWPRVYHLLGWTGAMMITFGTAGLVDGAVAGWSVRER